MARRKGFEYQPPTGPSENRRSLEYDSDFRVSGTTSRIAAPLFGLIFVAAGAFPFLVSLNLINIPGSKVHCPLFVLGAVGLAFIGAGFLVFFNGIGFARFTRFMGVLGLITILSFLTPFAWLAIAAPKVELIARIFIGFFVSVIGLAIVAGFAKTIVFGIPPQSQTAYKELSNQYDKYPPG